MAWAIRQKKTGPEQMGPVFLGGRSGGLTQMEGGLLLLFSFELVIGTGVDVGGAGGQLVGMAARPVATWLLGLRGDSVEAESPL